MKIVANILVILLAMWGSGASAQTYTYKVKFGMVHAGAATLVQNVEDGVLNSLFVMESSPWLSKLWTLSDSVMTEYVIDVGRLVSHTKAIHEGSYNRNYKVTFSDSNMATVNGKDKEVETQNLRDIPSLLYDLSLTQFHDGDTLQYLMWDGRGAGVLNLLVEHIDEPPFFRPFSETGWRLTPLNSTSKSRANQIQLSMLFSISFPHKPTRIEIDTKYGGVQMRLEDP
ncbi:MAG: DUF3108 domain-containing protein [Candidatus Marinimicrobia bacterium]|nr:DUF3108 domain-containing protein [Candidatus Neomarinimicrobiota bacterium]